MKKAKLITSSAVVMTMVMSSIVPAFAYSKEECYQQKQILILKLQMVK